ncbi:response regulator [Rhizobium sp. GN54]|uniref:response regulator n=1 Tax=Rhizobium sp. GN54 TaxID=2898150 RepID=UPI001E593D7D|nr:response regulator [Rhizobium sp. GN54]MCD2180670.1 response regulator [Rhizobium sp. GN54]
MTDGASVDASIQSEIFNAACDILGACVFVYDGNDCLVFVSRQARQFLPLDPQALIAGTRLRDVLGAIFDAGLRYGVDADQRHRVSREDWISTRISAHWREQHDSVERIGKDRWIRFRKRRLPNGYNISTLSDVTEQRKQEDKWRADMERAALTEQILDTLPHPLAVKDRNLAHVALNRAFRAVHGLEGGAMLGRTSWDLVDPEQAARIEESDRQVLASGVPFRLAEEIVKADGSRLYAITRKHRAGPPDRPVLVTVMEDLTDIIEPDAAAGRLALRAGIRFESGQNCFDPVRAVEKRLLLEQCRSDEATDLAGRRILVVTGNARIESLVVGELQARGADCCAVRSEAEFRAFVDVAGDCGVPIDMVLLDAAMDGYEAVSQAGLPVRTIMPDGIGADVFRALVEPHAVMVEVDEAPADPVMAASLFDDWHIATEADALAPAMRGDIEVLVAEDNQVNQFVFSQILEGLGISHRIAENGEEAVALWRKYMPRLVLMDIAMPLKNGIDAAIEIREAEKVLGVHTPIVAVTAQALNVDMQNCLDAGMDDYITKPVSPDMIERIYSKFVAEAAGRSAA